MFYYMYNIVTMYCTKCAIYSTTALTLSLANDRRMRVYRMAITGAAHLHVDAYPGGTERL